MTATEDRQLSRIRSLLAKAEHPSTPPPEAEALSEKAAELMARYAIDRALVDESSADRGAPQRREIDVLAPYAVPKVTLLANVASAYRVRVVVGGGVEARRCTLVGFGSDLDLVELLFTSLLLQAGTAVRLASAGRTRVRAFRHAFLIGYAQSVGQRIIAAQQRTVDATAPVGSTSTALVLADRRDAVDRAVDEMFPRLGRLRLSVSNGGGLVAGRAAGSRADLSTGGPAVAGGRGRALGGLER